MPSGVRPSIRLASRPIPLIFPVIFSIATTEGSLSTIPSPFTYTRVLAVPRSTAISFAGSQDIQFMWGTFIGKPPGTWLVKVNGRLCPANPTASESTCASYGWWQSVDRAEGHALDPGNDHLRDPHAPRHLERLRAQIHERHHQLAPIIAIDR